MDSIKDLLKRGQEFAEMAQRALPFFPTEDDIDELEYQDTLSALKRQLMTPDQLESLQSSARASAIRAASLEAAQEATQTVKTTATTAKAVEQTTVITHSPWVFSNKFGSPTTTSVVPVTSAVKSSATLKSVSSISSIRSSSSQILSSSSSARPSSSSTISLAPSSTSSTTVLTITRSASTSSVSAVPSVSAAAANDSDSPTGISTGAIAGIVVAVLVGVVALGAFIGWFYRKVTNRSYSNSTPWSKIEDDEITPFPASEKYGHSGDDDIYGASTAPVIGSRRALALARQNAFNEDGSYRPDTAYMMEADGNRAGLGAGANAYSQYPDVTTPYYGMDPHGRPYNPEITRAPMAHTYHNLGMANNNTRQLVGPGGYPQHDLTPHALGRPAAPVSNFAIAQHEDYADVPDPMTPTTVDYTASYTPRTATTMGEWGGDPRLPESRSHVSMIAPQGAAVPGARATSPVGFVQRPPAAAANSFPVPTVRSGPTSTSNSLPSFEPLSPLMSDFDFRRNSTQPLAMYEDDKALQKRMYGEVASTAGIPEPPTPKSAVNLNDSTNSSSSSGSYNTTASFGAPEPMPRLPSVTVNPPQPYVHGQPLSPLDEVPTPSSHVTGASGVPIPSSSLGHEINPYERTLLDANLPPAPPYSATSSTGATSFPSPAYPPPSPGGMSVPGSVTSSPQRWNTNEGKSRGRQTVYDEEDAYGGI